MKNTFGRQIRTRRESLIPLDPAMFSLREIAGVIRVEPSYLSKVERGLVPPPSEATILRLADAITLDSDVLLALAGKIPGDVRRKILKRPKLMARLVRQFARVSDGGVERAIQRSRRAGRKQ